MPYSATLYVPTSGVDQGGLKRFAADSFDFGGEGEFVAGAKEDKPKPKSVRIRLQPIRVVNRIGRNQPCPCGSGQKFKLCCGRKAAV